MNKAVIFDWSGTLSDDFRGFKEVCDLMFRALGREPISGEEIRLNFTLPYMKFWNKYFPDLTKEKQDELSIKNLPPVTDWWNAYGPGRFFLTLIFPHSHQ